VDEQLQSFARVLAAGGFFALLGAVFGGLVGYLSWKRGRPAGSAAGLAAARALARAAGRDNTPGTTGIVVGATDGLLFLGLAGTALGLLAARGHIEWTVPGRVAFGLLVLAGGAVFFGGLAFGIIYSGTRGVAGVFAGGMLGAVSGALLGRSDGIVIGAVSGVFAGTILGVTSRLRVK
jgi:hypothetical protein